MMKLLMAVLIAVCLVTSSTFAGQRTQAFDADPGWDALNNRVQPEHLPTVTQDFGYRETNLAGKDKGEIGGQVWRSATAASYAAKIPPKTLNDKLSASGTFAITATSGSSGAFFGWFNADAEQTGRQSSLGFRFAGQGSGARLTLQLVTAKNQACGTKITPWVVDKTKPRGAGRKFRPTSIRNDGTRYTWKMDYDPEANHGDGQIHFTICSNSAHAEAFEGKLFTIDLPPGYKDQDSTFDRFGLANSMRGGHAMTVHFDDVEHDGKVEDFSKDPGWIGTGNHVTFADRQRGGMHDFGFSATNFAGGAAAGEVGGTVWRSGAYAFYADRIAPLTLNDRLEASGKVVLSVGAPDSGMYFGWFNSAEKTKSPAESGNFLGVKIGGPTHVGHYFAPSYTTAAGTKIDRATGPLLVPRKVFDWRLVYDPSANDGGGAIQVTLADQSVTVRLKEGDKLKGASFDRFGLFTVGRGGSFVRIYFDDLKYTAAQEGS